VLTIKLDEGKSEFSAIRSYITELRYLALGPIEQVNWKHNCTESLNGKANKLLQRVIPIDVLRKSGAFFTGNNLGEQLLQQCEKLNNNSIYYDPSCGMGDLLLAAAKRLQLGNTLRETLKIWSSQIIGTDLQPEFIEGAKARLIILARQFHGGESLSTEEWDNYFPYIQVANGLNERFAYERATIILMNPPFGAVPAPKDCSWTRGRITESAIFVITALERIKPNTQILAILPDVLRSGSFSNQWRKKISELAEIITIENYGKFNQTTDIDVFLLKLIRRQTSKVQVNWNLPILNLENSISVSDLFYVHVGKVVPHRDKNEGQLYDFIHPRCVPTWTVMTSFTETRKHYGAPFKPPFLVLRRTSRPGDLYRATATVISGDLPIAVENHLIVCLPKDGKITTCMALMQHFKTEKVNRYLDVRIRCRHLTVGAVSSIPYTL
jgi:hypothetical protein